jgi:hypothetical protein
MAIEWLAGNRLRGTTAERPSGSLQSPSVGGWKEVGRTTLGSKTSPMTVASLADKRYYMVLSSALADGTNRAAAVRRLGNGSVDTGSNYSSRRNDNGGLESTNTNVTVTGNVNLSSDKTPQFAVDYVSNLSSKEKLAITNIVLQNTAGAGTSPQRAESVWKWTNTSNPLNYYEITREPSESGDWESGSEVVVLGWDPDDTHTDNFWEELASVSADGSSNTLSASFTSKKYLWVQCYEQSSAGSVSFRVGNSTLDTGNNYAVRYSSNGGAEDLTTGVSSMDGLTSTTPIFWNYFIINNSANEKLAICHVVRQNTAGAGTAPNRIESVSKWANTSAQIDTVGFTAADGGATILSNSILKVWGSD